MHYFFDITAADGTTVDEEGLSIDAPELMRVEAARLLAEIALHDATAKGNSHQNLEVAVREGARVVYTARLVITDA